MRQVNRRDFVASVAAAAGASLLPARAFAQPLTSSVRDQRILQIARRQVSRAGNMLWRRDMVGVLDFGIHSVLPRFHFANLENGTVQSYRVAHGSGSDSEHDGWLKRFSNVPGSNATSRGNYMSSEIYVGSNGTSLRMMGLDPENSNVFDRAIVIHSAEYCTQAQVDRWGRLGRSNGCFAMAPQDLPAALAQLSGGRLLYADSLGIGPNGEQALGPASPAPRYA
jgi:hypothetical protein